MSIQPRWRYAAGNREAADSPRHVTIPHENTIQSGVSDERLFSEGNDAWHQLNSSWTI